TEVDRQADGGVGIVGDVVPRAADQCVRASAAAQVVVTGVAAERVVERAAAQVLDGAVGIARGVAGVIRWIAQVGDYPAGRVDVIGVVAPRSAVQDVRPRAAAQEVVAGVAGERVVERAAANALDGNVAVSGGFAGVVRRIAQVDDDSGGRIDII